MRGRLPTERSSPAGSTASHDRVRPRGARALHAAVRRVVEPRLAHERASDRRERTAARPSSSTVRRVRAFTGPPLAFSPDGRWLVLKRGKALWSPVPGSRAFASAPRVAGRGPSFTPDSRFVSTETAARRARSARGGSRRSGPRLRHRRLVAGRPPCVRGLPGGVREREASGRHGSRLRDRHAWPQSARRRAVPLRRSQLQRAALAAGRLAACSSSPGPRAAAAVSSPCRRGVRHTRVDHDPRNLETPTWSPDGTRIAGERAELHLSPRSGPAEPHRDRRAGRLGRPSRDRRRRPASSAASTGSRRSARTGAGSRSHTARSTRARSRSPLPGAAVSGRPCSPTATPSPRSRSGRRTARGSPTPSGGRSRPSRRAAGRPR